ncbi:hypothetical protein [Actinophytocola sp.]|uniref:hypothetical protein n=1 Tax=Actinophytocola sp. TaxID=1872138 RepID=UPI002D808102|nr:hypothetical protein [Actinophytocola sp.]HET9143008.1 hypothetical protein [Actinophytocola sp.]
MKHIWRVEGAYLEWEMIVRVRPAKQPPRRLILRDQDEAICRLKRLGHLFHDLVNLHEYSLEFGDRSRAGLRELTVTSGTDPN